MTSPDDLGVTFEELAVRLEELIELLDAADERLWLRYMRRGLQHVRERRLAGATYVLGCYGGENTFSDLVVARGSESGDSTRYLVLNRRLHHLRDSIFRLANDIASRSAG